MLIVIGIFLAYGYGIEAFMGCFFFFFNDTATTEIYTGWYTFPYTTLFRSLCARRLPQVPVRLRRLARRRRRPPRSEEHTSELQSHHPISYAVFCLKKKN